MQKFKIFTFLVLIIFPLISFAQELFVEVEDRGRYFQINMRTFQDQKSMYQLKVSKVDIEKPTFSHDGIIDLYVVVDTNRNWVEKVGPYKGSFTLRRSSNIPVGRYSLYINDEDYGFLYILEDKHLF